VQFEHTNEVVDPRVIVGTGPYHDMTEEYKFRFSVKGRILTITRTGDDEGRPGGEVGFYLRVYRRSTEGIPDFASTVYLYHGLDHEWAPKDTTEINFHPSVTRIKNNAFSDCRSLVRVTIPDTVTRIDDHAFDDCISLRLIRFSRNLEYIEEIAFYHCESVEAVFLPPTVTHIDDGARGAPQPWYSIRYQCFSTCRPSFLKIWQVSSSSRRDNPGCAVIIASRICVMITRSIATQVVEPPVLVCCQHGL